MPASDSEQRQSRRLQLVDEHVGLENRHDLNGIITTLSAAARYDDEPWDAHYIGRDGVRTFYAVLLHALPDLLIDVQRRHVSDATNRPGSHHSRHHLGAWRGLPPTGRLVQFPLCGIYTFDEDDRLAGEKIYYDRASVLRQLGVFHEPDGILGRINAVVMHPVTMARMLGRMIWRI
jgi:steroid delta-isomerase-like uncharacterized protein